MQFVFIYVATYIFVALFCAVLLLRTNPDIGRQMEVRYFRLLLASLLVYCITESIWSVGNFGLSESINQFNIPLTIVNSILINTLCYLWFCYMESYLEAPWRNNRMLRFIAALPFIAAILLSVSSLWTNWVFFIEPNGSAGRGPLYIVIIILAYAYAAIATLRSSIGAVRATNSQRRRELITMSLFVIPPAMVGVIDTLVPMMPIVAPAFFFSFLIVFTMLQDAQISTDSLTGLNNRRRAEHHLDGIRANASAEKPGLFFILDANGFKAINDNYGHLEGDRALRIIADALRNACKNTGVLVSRWGGDEFVVVTTQEEVGTPDEFIQRIHSHLEQECAKNKLSYPLTVSVGYSLITDPDIPARSILQTADEMLYRIKGNLSR